MPSRLGFLGKPEEVKVGRLTQGFPLAAIFKSMFQVESRIQLAGHSPYLNDDTFPSIPILIDG